MKLVLAALLCACGGGDATTPGATSADGASAGGACWPVAVMRLEALEHRTEWEPIAEMMGDGSIYDVRKERHFIGRVAHDQLLDAHDVPTITCTHREIYSPMNPSLKAHYGAHDEYLDESMTLTIGDDGMVDMTNGSRRNPDETKIRVVGPIASTRRTAELLVIAALAAAWSK